MKKSEQTVVLVVGELNVDLILNDLQSFPEVGKEVLAQQMTYTLGSSSAIFASNLSSLGSNVMFLGKVGQDSFGDFVIEHLDKAGISNRFVITQEDLSTGITVILNVEEDRAMVTYPGAMEHLSADEITDRHLAAAGHLHVSSVFLQPSLKPGLTDLFKRAKKAGITTSLDPQWDPAEQWELPLSELLPLTDLFLPNEVEFLNLTGTSNCEDGLDEVREFCNLVVIKRGNEGAWLYDGDEIYKSKPYLNKNVVDAIGAGDSFNAGFIHRFLTDENLDECLDFANLVGAVSTTAAGGTSGIKNIEQVLETGRRQLGYE